jgi:hypothetical protein
VLRLTAFILNVQKKMLRGGAREKKTLKWKGIVTL